MVDVILTLAQLQALFQSLTVSLTGLDDDRGVRLSWPTRGQPDWKITEDVAFIRITTSSEPIIAQRDTVYSPNDDTSVQETTSYTRVHRVSWIIYGPNAYDNSQALRDGLYSQAAHDTLAASNLYMVLDVPAVSRAPEPFNGQWWERCDLSARFNEGVTRGAVVPALASAQIIVVSDDGTEEVIN
jgi:hypothetical protein